MSAASGRAPGSSGIEVGGGRFANRFDGRAGAYSRYRPRYPSEIIQKLHEEAGFDKETIVADIGSGTGILSELFLKNGNVVYCVEPNADMRRAAKRNLKKHCPRFISVEGTAEATGLEDASVGLVTVGQALHWFDGTKARNEFKRILKRSGHVLIVHNCRKEEGGANQAYSKLTRRFSRDMADVPDINRLYISRFLRNRQFSKFVVPNYQTLSFKGLLGRLSSASYAPPLGSPKWSRLENAMRTIFDKYSRDGVFTLHYDTTFYVGELV